MLGKSSVAILGAESCPQEEFLQRLQDKDGKAERSIVKLEDILLKPMPLSTTHFSPPRVYITVEKYVCVFVCVCLSVCAVV